MDFSVDECPKDDQSDSGEGGQSNASSDDAERKSTRFTQYSLSSSVVPRSESTYIADIIILTLRLVLLCAYCAVFVS